MIVFTVIGVVTVVFLCAVGIIAIVSGALV